MELYIHIAYQDISSHIELLYNALMLELMVTLTDSDYSHPQTGHPKSNFSMSLYIGVLSVNGTLKKNKTGG